MTRLPDELVGYSRGMFSNWCWHRPLQLMIDAGEGVQLALGTHVFAVSVLAITHGHSDHVLGLPGLIAARRFSKGATDKPLTVVYPEGSRGVLAVRQWLDTAFAGVTFPVLWQPMQSGDRVALGGGRTLEATTAVHTPGEPALAYRVTEERRQLRPEFRDWTRDAIEAAARAGDRERMTEMVTHVRFAHSGDAMPLDPVWVAGADVLVHDATFLVEADRRERIHATTDEALQVAATAGVAQIVLQHLSVRYSRPSSLDALRTQVSAHPIAHAWLLDDHRLVPLTDAAAATLG
ncbi:MAG: MBL fold metallo-hydrolase [Acidobacteria bacterium]|nr:MBL fold metallo-hydrolase [Acidobacteriota bacterium]